MQLHGLLNALCELLHARGNDPSKRTVMKTFFWYEFAPAILRGATASWYQMTVEIEIGPLFKGLRSAAALVGR